MIHDDQAVILNVRGKGLVVLTGCGHSGIINIVRHAKRLTGVEQVYAVLGGFHLSGRVFGGTEPADCGRGWSPSHGRGGTSALHRLDGTVGAGERDA